MDIAMNIAGLFFIFFARIIDVSCSIVRILFLVKGQRFLAVCIGFFEVMVYMVVLGYVLGGGKALTFAELIFYCGGFATGNYIGAWMEERLLNSFILVEVILDDGDDARASISKVRDMGLGATVINGMGRDGPKLVVEIFCHRHDVMTVQTLFNDRGFVTISDVKRCTGGWFPKRL
ncbi:MAG: DUF5698 domain-containing protein [Synergistaceae bacterium]|jgi:uncharacterized protein YebE (UPF0316 family)|nr:DUF5698 domain-containing protein [Synergistaceae bacterium]